MFSILVTVRLYTVMAEVCRWLTNERQRKTGRRVTEAEKNWSSCN